MPRFGGITRKRERLLWISLWILSLYLVLNRKPSTTSQPHSKFKDQSWFSLGKPSTAPQSRPNGNDLCSEEEYLAGGWFERSEVMITHDDVRKAYGFLDLAELKCQPVDDPVHRLPTDPEYTSRVLEAAKYEWIPRSGCRKYQWDRLAFARRCLRAKAGLTFVGDSLTEHTFAVVHGLMVGSDGLFLSDGTPDQVFRVFLNAGHPDASALLLSAGVDPSRADTPLINFYRDHHVLSRAEMDDTFKGVDGYIPFDARNEEQDRIKWVAGERKWWDLWKEKLGFNLVMVPDQNGQLFKMEKSVIVFNVGPHWSRGEMTPNSEAMNLNAVSNGYIRMVANVLSKLKELPTTEILSFWRAVSPGDPECEQYPGPVNNRTTHKSSKNKDAWQFNWDAYPEMNRHVSSRLSYVPSTSTSRLRPTKEPMRYLDVWPISVTRPDAHLKPAIDCMHYCIPSVPNEWIAFLWHLMVIDSVNDDYAN